MEILKKVGLVTKKIAGRCTVAAAGDSIRKTVSS